MQTERSLALVIARRLVDLESLPLSDQLTITANGLVRREITIGLGFRTLDGALDARLTVAVAPHQVSDYEAPSLLGLDFLYRLNLTVEPTHSRLQGLAPYVDRQHALERRIPAKACDSNGSAT